MKYLLKIKNTLKNMKHIKNYEEIIKESDSTFIYGYEQKDTEIGDFWKEQKDLLDEVLKPYGQKVLENAKNELVGKTITIKNLTITIKEFTDVRTGSNLIHDYVLIGRTTDGRVFELACDHNISLWIK